MAWGLVTLTLLLGCKSTDRSSPFAELDSASPPPVTLTFLPGAPPPKPPFKARMKEHTIHGVTMRDAVARGDLEAAKVAARALADLPIEGDLDPARRQKLDAMSTAAQRALSAKDLYEGSRAVAAVAQTCGGCHVAFGGPRVSVADASSGEPAVGPHMERHQWAAARLWEGLAGPSDEAWKKGARVLTDAPLEPERLTPGKSPVPAVGRLATSVHDLGRKAASLDETAARVELYGELLDTCASCHQRLGGGPRGAKR